MLKTETNIEAAEAGLTTIDAGIGTIEYRTDNLALEYIMEALHQRIKSDGYKAVLSLLDKKK